MHTHQFTVVGRPLDCAHLRLGVNLMHAGEERYDEVTYVYDDVTYAYDEVT